MITERDAYPHPLDTALYKLSTCVEDNKLDEDPWNLMLALFVSGVAIGTNRGMTKKKLLSMFENVIDSSEKHKES